MRKQFYLLFILSLLGLLYTTPSWGQVNHVGLTCDWWQEGHIIGVDGSNMPTSFVFQMDVDTDPSFCVAYEWITYDGSLSGNNAQINNKIVYSQALSAMLTGKSVVNCGQYVYVDGGHACLSKAIRVFSSD